VTGDLISRPHACLSANAMGGTKKKTISQMEKQQRLKELKERREREKAGKGRKKAEEASSARAVVASEEQLKLMEQEALEAGYLTPFVVASKLNVKLSAAKMLLRDAEARGIVKLVAKSPRTLIYAPAAAAVSPAKPT
jgi:small subunit ribosomal protein S25e